MKNFLDKIFFRSNNLNDLSSDIKNLTNSTPIDKIFTAIQSFSSEGDIRYVGGCIRKIINKEKISDIDLATNLEPKQICEALERKKINYYETGIDHGTITAVIEKYKFEITSLRRDVFTDGRHAKVQFSNNWKEDASRRDFTINAIYSDKYGNIFDPYDGKKDLENGLVNFIGDTEKRIKEDYLRILRYLRFFLGYSKKKHDLNVLKKLKINIGGISRLSKERLLDELKKMINLEILEKLSKDKQSLEIFLMIFPELKNIGIFSKLSFSKREFSKKLDFILLISLLIIDDSDNADYFLYKFNLSKKDQKRIKTIDNFFKEKLNNKLSENNLNKIFYFNGKQAVIDILNFKIFKLKKFEKNLLELVEKYQNMATPIMPIGADILMKKYKIAEGKLLGLKLKRIENEWVSNNFQITEKQVDNILKN